jgi:flagellar protein FliS
MSYNEIANIYRQESTHGTRPVELVGKLYEAIIEDFRRAVKAIIVGDVSTRTASLNHALEIIAELQSVLDHEQGGEVSHRLDGFYNVTRSLVIEANTHGKPEHVHKLVDLYLPLRQAWKQVELEASTGKADTSVKSLLDASKAVPTTEQPKAASTDETRAQWSA